MFRFVGAYNICNGSARKLIFDAQESGTHFNYRHSRYRHVEFTMHFVQVQCCLKAFKSAHVFDVERCLAIIKIMTKSIPQTIHIFFAHYVTITMTFSQKRCASYNVGIPDTGELDITILCVLPINYKSWHLYPTHTHFTSSSHSKNPFLPVD